MHISNELAQRLELAEALDGVLAAQAMIARNPESGAAVQMIGGGYALFAGLSSPLTHAIAVGMNGPVTAAAFDELQQFFRDRAAPVTIDLCPHADPTLIEFLRVRRFSLAEMNSVLIRPLTPGEVVPQPAEIEIRESGEAERDEYAHLIMKGFFGRDELNEHEQELGGVIAFMQGPSRFVAAIGGVLAGGGSLSIRNGLASFYGDATLSDYRRRGVHGALIAARLQAAVNAGCDMATAGTLPGSVSQRDFERFGFRVAYTKATMMFA